MSVSAVGSFKGVFRQEPFQNCLKKRIAFGSTAVGASVGVGVYFAMLRSDAVLAFTASTVVGVVAALVVAVSCYFFALSRMSGQTFPVDRSRRESARDHARRNDILARRLKTAVEAIETTIEKRRSGRKIDRDRYEKCRIDVQARLAAANELLNNRNITQEQAIAYLGLPAEKIEENIPVDYIKVAIGIAEEDKKRQNLPLEILDEEVCRKLEKILDHDDLREITSTFVNETRELSIEQKRIVLAPYREKYAPLIPTMQSLFTG